MPNNYIITSSGSFLSEEELYHHGVKGMKWGVRKRVANSKAVGKVRSRYTNIRNASKKSASASLQRHNGNTKKAMASTAAKTFGSAAAVNLGGRAVSALLGAGSVGAAASGHVGLAVAGSVASKVVRSGTKAASWAMTGYGTMKLADIYKQGKKS